MSAFTPMSASTPFTPWLCYDAVIISPSSQPIRWASRNLGPQPEPDLVGETSICRRTRDKSSDAKLEQCVGSIRFRNASISHHPTGPSITA